MVVVVVAMGPLNGEQRKISLGWGKGHEEICDVIITRLYV